MSISSWLMAARPRTLGLSVTPVVVGAALAWALDGQVHWLAVLAALIASMFIQMGTNLHNDAVDSERGGDGPDRIGPPRVTAMGLLTGRRVKRGACTCFGIAALLGLYLIAVGGWPIFAARHSVDRRGLGLYRRTVADRLYAARRIVRHRLLRPRRGRRHLLAVRRPSRRAGARRWSGARAAHRRGAAGQQFPRRRSRRAGRPAHARHRRRDARHRVRSMPR